MASLLVLDNVCHLICSRYKESPQHGYGEFFVIKQLFRKLFCSLFDLHFLCRSLLQAHYLSVDTVNFGHKKTQPKLGRCVGYLSVVMY